MTPQEQALGELRAIGIGAITADDLADFAAASADDAKAILQGWKNIAAVRNPTVLTQMADVLSRVAEYAPIAAKVIAIAALL